MYNYLRDNVYKESSSRDTLVDLSQLAKEVREAMAWSGSILVKAKQQRQIQIQPNLYYYKSMFNF